ncbi:MAG: Re/Si-specific NAD(P)(+) transhydrogenase subunit alpha [Candidatus Nanopelagicales bacterium]
MAALRVGVAKEVAPGERRVALTPDVLGKLAEAGIDVLVEAGAGAGAWFPDEKYEQAGARITDSAGLYADADVVLSVGRPDLTRLRAGQTVVGMLAPLLNANLMQDVARRGVTIVSLDGLPRTLTRAQGMDALSSQSNVSGYKAVLVAAERFDRFFPMMITAAGTAKPAEVLVLGAGVAGLQAIGTAKRLGAIVRGYDVRAASKDEVKSLGGQFIELTSVENTAGEGGYARALSEQEQAAQQAELTDHIVKHDIVITTAQVPGRRPPLLVTAAAVARMRPGSVIVDMGASELGGNVEGSVPGQTVVTDNGVTVIGAGDLPSRIATSASNTYSRNMCALLLHLVDEGSLAIGELLASGDEIAAGVVITHDGAVVQPATAALLADQEASV